ncbi:MAG: phosphate signaling complex protein PhoU [Pirellula sp.]|nr:phosphate signaling complex protein PhoU [Pirellula sp.]
MSLHLTHDLAEAHKSLLRLSGVVEKMIDQAVQSLVARQADVALMVIGQDEEIDRIEVKIEEDCLKMLALHQPVAADLRRITTMMKINNDLERMADLACNIAQRAISVHEYPDFQLQSGLQQMALMAINMVRRSLDAFVRQDVNLALEVIRSDDAVDSKNVDVIAVLNDQMQRDISQISPAMHCFSASRHLEQIADHAVSIAEDTIYMVRGEIVRHRQHPPVSFQSHSSP